MAANGQIFLGGRKIGSWLFLLLQRAGHQTDIGEVASDPFVSHQCSAPVHLSWCCARGNRSSKTNGNDQSFCYGSLFGGLRGTGILDGHNVDYFVCSNCADISHREYGRCVCRKGRDPLCDRYTASSGITGSYSGFDIPRALQPIGESKHARCVGF